MNLNRNTLLLPLITGCLTIVSGAHAAECTVEAVAGYPGSYLPPRPGDTVSLDLENIVEIDRVVYFDRGSETRAAYVGFARLPFEAVSTNRNEVRFEARASSVRESITVKYYRDVTVVRIRSKSMHSGQSKLRWGMDLRCEE